MSDTPATPDTTASPETGIALDTIHTAMREHISDRTGELMATAFHNAEKHIRTNVVGVDDPRDKTRAHFALGIDGRVAVIPAEAWDGYRQFPLAREGVAVLTQLASFISLVNRFKEDETTVVFADDNLARPSLTAIFDYHPANGDLIELDDGSITPPPVMNLRHRASYRFPLSEEWQAWHGMDGKPMTMREFAAFLEDHIVDVSDDSVDAYSEQGKAFVKANGNPRLASQARLIALSREFKVYETHTSVEAANLTSGETQFTFQSEHKDASGKPVDFPGLFSIVIPIFARSNIAYRLLARLRYRIANGKPAFWFDLWRADLTFEAAFNEACEQVMDQTGLPLFAGAPEIATATV